jgi:hypothetical protein
MTSGGSSPRILPPVLCIAMLCLTGAGPGDPSGERILKNIEAGRAGVKDYTVMLDIVANVEKMKVPPMKAKMFFKQPDKVHFDSKSFALLPREGLVLNPATLMKQYSILRVYRDTLGGVPVFTLELRALSENSRVQRLDLTANPAHWTIDRVQMPRRGDRTLSMEFRYGEFGGFWLPVEVVASFRAAAADTADSGSLDSPVPVRPPQVPHTGTITVRYSDYHINAGLSDSIFTAGAN